MKTKILFSVVLIAVLSLGPVLTNAIYDGSDSTQSPAGVLAGYAIINLKDQPLSSYDGHIPGYAKTMPSPGQKLDLNSLAAQAYSSYLANERSVAKGWMKNNAPEVQVVDEYSVVLNALAVSLNGHNVNHLLNAPGASSASGDYLYQIQMNRSPVLIGAPVLWAADGGNSSAGAGEKIGIIDTGIDQTHPFLTDTSLPAVAGFPKCDAIDSAVGLPDTSCNFVSNKVIVAKVFETLTNFDAHAAQAHGSHVSGTAAGVNFAPNNCAPFVGCTLSGIAPKAYLGNYNVFPGNVLSASSHDIAKAVEAAVADGMDVLNLSLGGTANPNDVLVNAVNDATDAGVVVAIAAGNSGPNPGTIQSPGIADKVITAGASTNPHFIGIPVTVNPIGTFGAALGQFASFDPAVTNTYNVTSPTNGCTSINPIISGMIALIARGACTFSTKIRNAQAAGATGVIVYNSQQGDPIAMAQDSNPIQPTIPAVMVSKTKGLAMAAIAPASVTVDGTTPSEFFTDGPSADILASFSSIGPPLLQTAGVGLGQPQNKIKPDVTAPGVNVYSSVPSFACSTPPCFAFFQGTSMATPHVAGSAALLLQLHPGWSPQQVKSALVNSAHRPVKSFTSGSELSNPMRRGGGRIDLAAASKVTATLDTGNGQPSFSFGELSSGGITRDFTITLTSVATSTITYTVSVVPGSSGPSITPSVTSLKLAAGGTGTVTISLSLSPSLPNSDYFGDIQFTGGAVPLSVPYWVSIDPPSGSGGSPARRT